MKMINTRWTFALALTLSLITLLTAGCENCPCLSSKKEPAKDDSKMSAPPAPKADPNVVTLFDGKTMGNWKPTNFGGEGEVEIKDGTMIIHLGAPISGVTWQGQPPAKVNYEISLEAQRVDGTDFFCGLTVPVKDTSVSLICGGWGGGVTGLSSLDGIDASENETTGYLTYENGKWYKIKVQVLDTRIRAWVNGEQVVNVDTTEKRIDVRIEVELSKPLGIATFQTTGAYRNIEFRKLTAEQVKAAIAEAKKAESP
ncbi:MAG: DUF1080 domain-containing protein [Phycisphaeraceae bacterium]